MYDERNNESYDFTKKTDLRYTELFLTPDAPHGFTDRETFWNAADNAERRYDARTGRALRIALPNELPLSEHIRIVREYAAVFTDIGICVDVAIHEGRNQDDPSKNNPHAHFLLADRPIDRNGFYKKKDRSWNKRANARIWREMLANIINLAYERNGLAKRVCHESYEDQGLKERNPTKHLGRAATEMERRGIRTDKGNENRDIVAGNEKKDRQRQLELDKNFDYGLSR